MLKPIPCPRCGMMPEIDTGFSDAPYPPGQEYVSCPGVRVGIPGVVDQSCGTHAIGVAAWNYRAIPAADARAERDALRAKVARLEGALVDHNDLLRSALSIAKREGVDGEVASTNWDAYYNRVAVVLNRHHQIANEAFAALTDGGKDG